MHNITLLARDIQYFKLYAVLRGSHSMSPKELTQRIQMDPDVSMCQPKAQKNGYGNVTSLQ